MADDYTAPAQRIANDVVTAADWNAQIPDNITALKNAIDGDAQATSEVIHQHKSGTFANRPAAGNAGRIYYSTDLGVTFLDDGAVWHVMSWVPALCAREYTDFGAIFGGTDDGDGAPGGSPFGTAGEFPGGWRLSYNGGAGASAMGGGAGHSYMQLISAAAGGGAVHYSPRLNGDGYIDLASANNLPLIMECAVRIHDGADVDFHFGIMDGLSVAASPAPNSSVMFRIEDAGNVVTVSQDNGGGEETNDTGAVPTGTNIDLFRVEVITTASATLTWWKGGLGGTKYTEAHTTVPDAETLHPGFSVRANAAAAKTLSVDYCDVLYKRSY
jgi:hypothetical protein